MASSASAADVITLRCRTASTGTEPARPISVTRPFLRTAIPSSSSPRWSRASRTARRGNALPVKRGIAAFCAGFPHSLAALFNPHSGKISAAGVRHRMGYMKACNFAFLYRASSRATGRHTGSGRHEKRVCVYALRRLCRRRAYTGDGAELGGMLVGFGCVAYS